MPKVKPEEIRLAGSRLLCRKYVKPEKIGMIWLNPLWRTDNSRALWELVAWSPAAEEALGMKLKKDYILITPPRRGYYCSDIELPDGDAAFFLEASEVIQIYPWISEDVEEAA